MLTSASGTWRKLEHAIQPGNASKPRYSDQRTHRKLDTPFKEHEDNWIQYNMLHMRDCSNANADASVKFTPLILTAILEASCCHSLGATDVESCHLDPSITITAFS